VFVVAVTRAQAATQSLSRKLAAPWATRGAKPPIRSAALVGGQVRFLAVPSLVDSDETATGAFRVAAWPTAVLINREGTIAFYAVGAEPEKLSQAIR